MFLGISNLFTHSESGKYYNVTLFYLCEPNILVVLFFSIIYSDFKRFSIQRSIFYYKSLSLTNDSRLGFKFHVFYIVSFYLRFISQLKFYKQYKWYISLVFHLATAFYFKLKLNVKKLISIRCNNILLNLWKFILRSWCCVFPYQRI